MTNCNEIHHAKHNHTHGTDCDYVAIQHADLVDYLHGGNLHHPHGNHVDEHLLEVSDKNPDVCTPEHHCSRHAPDHVHGPDCGHEEVPHGDQVDYPVGGHLHHPHGDHCDNYGPVKIIR